MEKQAKCFAIPPGDTIKELLEYRSMTQKEFALRMDMSEKHISKFLSGDVLLGPDMAMRLEMVLGMPAHFWSGLEAIYRENLRKNEEIDAMDADAKLIKKYPYSDMAKVGWVEDTNDIGEKISQMRKHFEVVKLTLVQDPLAPGIAYNNINMSEKEKYARLAWAQKGKLSARSTTPKEFNLKKLQKKLSSIKSLTKLNEAIFLPKLAEVFADCGVVLSILPKFESFGYFGATFKEKNKVVLCLTIENRDAYAFWFNLFHELAHIFLGHLDKVEGLTKANELEANAWVDEQLIPVSLYNEVSWIREGVTEKDILSVSAKNGTDPCVLVGRLKKDGFIKGATFDKFERVYGAISEKWMSS